MDVLENLEFYKKLLRATVNGLIAEGYEESGGSNVWRLLHDEDDNCIKVFLNDYAFPTHIIIRLSS